MYKNIDMMIFDSVFSFIHLADSIDFSQRKPEIVDFLFEHTFLNEEYTSKKSFMTGITNSSLCSWITKLPDSIINDNDLQFANIVGKVLNMYDGGDKFKYKNCWFNMRVLKLCPTIYSTEQLHDIAGHIIVDHELVEAGWIKDYPSIIFKRYKSLPKDETIVTQLMWSIGLELYNRNPFADMVDTIDDALKSCSDAMEDILNE